MLTLALLKIAVPVLLVAVMSLAARWWGPTVGGLLLGVPWMTGPVLFFLALDKGPEFAVGACTGIELGVACVAPFALAYGVVSVVAGWRVCLAAASLAFGASAFALKDVALSLPTASAAAAVSLVGGYMLLPRGRATAVSAGLPWWDIPARMATTFILVSIIMFMAEALGSRLSGIASTYPAMTTVLVAFTHQQWGRDAARHMLRGLMLSLLMFVIFFLTVGMILPTVSLVPSFAIAATLVFCIDGVLLVAMRQGSAGGGSLGNVRPNQAGSGERL